MKTPTPTLKRITKATKVTTEKKTKMLEMRPWPRIKDNLKHPKVGLINLSKLGKLLMEVIAVGNTLGPSAKLQKK